MSICRGNHVVITNQRSRLLRIKLRGCLIYIDLIVCTWNVFYCFHRMFFDYWNSNCFKSQYALMSFNSMWGGVEVDQCYIIRGGVSMSPTLYGGEVYGVVHILYNAKTTIFNNCQRKSEIRRQRGVWIWRNQKEQETDWQRLRCPEQPSLAANERKNEQGKFESQWMI